ncbi:MAG TPA: hypothetical protein VFZ23_00850, partial [Pyrinomonadaceae bacterium]
MLKILLLALLPILVLFGIGLNSSITGPGQKGQEGNSGTLEKMIVTDGGVTIDLNLGRLTGAGRSKVSRTSELRFDVERDSFFTVVVFNDELRGPQPGSMRLIPQA